MTRDVSEASSRRSTDHTDRPTLAVAGPIAHVVAARTGARSHRPPNVGRGGSLVALVARGWLWWLTTHDPAAEEAVETSLETSDQRS